MDLSIIIPIYNTDEKSLERCFSSICEIDGIRYECLLIDDGSKPETVSFCEKYASENSAFRYIRKDNGGVSTARNLGIREAVGKFICFVDSDDEIVPDVYNMPALLNDNYDLIFTDLLELNGKHHSVWKAFDRRGEIPAETAIECVIKDGKLNGPYCKLIKRSFLDESGVWFREDMIQGEDAVFIRELLCQMPKMYYCDKVSYLYNHSYVHGNQRFINNPGKCILNAMLLNEASNQCIERGGFSDQDKTELLNIQNRTYIHELFCRAMDSLEYHIFSEYLRIAIIDAIPQVRYEALTLLDIVTKLKIIMLRAKKWSALKLIEKMRSQYYRFKEFR